MVNQTYTITMQGTPTKDADKIVEDLYIGYEVDGFISDGKVIYSVDSTNVASAELIGKVCGLKNVKKCTGEGLCRLEAHLLV